MWSRRQALKISRAAAFCKDWSLSISCFGRPARVAEPYSQVWKTPAPRWATTSRRLTQIGICFVVVEGHKTLRTLFLPKETFLLNCFVFELAACVCTQQTDRRTCKTRNARPNGPIQYNLRIKESLSWRRAGLSVSLLVRRFPAHDNRQSNVFIRLL